MYRRRSAPSRSSLSLRARQSENAAKTLAENSARKLWPKTLAENSGRKPWPKTLDWRAMGAGRGRLNWDRHEKPTRMDRLQEPTMSRDLAANGRRSLWPFQLPFQCLFNVSSKSLQMSLRMSPADHGPKPSRDIKHTAMFPYGRTAPARAARPARRNRELSKRSTLPSLADPPL